MTRDEIIAMAKEAGCVSATFWPDGFTGLMGVFERFAALVAEADRAARIAAQTEAAELKERLARSGVEQRRAVREAVLAEREACAVLLARMTERRRWTRAGINGEAMMPCEYAEAIRARGAA